MEMRRNMGGFPVMSCFAKKTEVNASKTQSMPSISHLQTSPLSSDGVGEPTHGGHSGRSGRRSRIITRAIGRHIGAA